MQVGKVPLGWWQQGWLLLMLAVAVAVLGAALPVAAGPSLSPPAMVGCTDCDDDGLLNADEVAAGTDPDDPDSDGDGIRDGVDPDVLAAVVAQLPDSAFKSRGRGHRNALLKRLRNNQRQLVHGKIDGAIHSLRNLLRHVDGCPLQPDRDDWLIDCAAQLQVRRLAQVLLANHVTYAVDPTIEPAVASVPGLMGGQEREVGVALDPEGNPEPFVLDEVIVHPADAAALDAFLVRYDGVVLRDGTPMLLSGSEPVPGLPDRTGAYLVGVDSRLSPLDDLAANMERAGLRGGWVFSSDAAARLAALVAREVALGASLNFTMDLSQSSVLEHPDGAGGFLDASTWAWMTEDDDPHLAGDQGLSVGVVHAWEYVQYKGYPPVDVPFEPVRVAVIDAGFDLDPTTGEPLFGAGDYPSNLLQLDVIDMDQTAGGPGYGFANCDGCWHGQLTFGVCCALSQNGYGTAGTSGGWDIEPLVIRATSDIDTVTNAVYSALYNGADVIHETIAFGCGWWCRTFGGGGDLRSIVETARTAGSIFVTPAQNQGRDISDAALMPCNVNGAVCVGAVLRDGSAASYSNWGSIVDIWAPTDILSTVTRDSAARDADDVGSDELEPYGGTSAATPYLTGIVALMKMVNPGLQYDDVRSILVSTANPSTDAKVRDRGYVDAFRAVVAASPNLPPRVKILAPTYGDREPYSNITLRAQVNDPESPSPVGVRGEFTTSLEFRSDRDGLLCSASGEAGSGGTELSCEVAAMSLGGHLIHATARDPFGAVGEDFVNFAVINTPPVVRIAYPPDGTTIYSNQPLNLRGAAFDDETYGYIPVSWHSSVSGPLGTSGDFWVELPPGAHQITLSATDEKGAMATDSITLQVESPPVGAGHPAVQIVAPVSGKTFAPGELISFSGRATDPEDGEVVEDSAFRWTSSVDGYLGSGRNLQRPLSVTGEATVHAVTLEVTDSDGNPGSHTISVVGLRPQ